MSDAAPVVRALVPLGLEDEFDVLAFLSGAAALAASSQARLEVTVAGAQPDAALAHEALARGAAAVCLATHAALAPPVNGAQAAAALAEALAASGLAQGTPTVCLLPPCAAGEETAARLAVRLGGAALGRCTGIALGAEGVVATRAVFGGRAEARLRTATLAFGVVRLSAPAVPSKVQDGEVHALQLHSALPAPLESTREQTPVTQKRLEGARIVVSGGRGMAGPEGFALLGELAEALGGALGGSLPSVDAGWVPVSRQVGQSGKFVSPSVYVAVGISGTPQHLAGIAAESRIVAVNSDPEAPIFQVAELGCVADWRELLPPLLARLREPAG